MKYYVSFTNQLIVITTETLGSNLVELSREQAKRLAIIQDVHGTHLFTVTTTINHDEI